MEVQLQGSTVLDDGFSVRGGDDGINLIFGLRDNISQVMDENFNLGWLQD